MADERIASPDITFADGNGPERASVTWEDHAIKFRSPWTGKRTDMRRWGMWKLEYDWNLLPQSRAAVVLPQFGTYGTHTSFTIPDVTRLVSNGTATTAQLDGLKVDGDDQTGQTLNVKMTVSAAPGVLLFKAHDLIGMHTGEVYEVAADATSGSGGDTAVSLVQWIGTSPNDNSQVFSVNVPFTVRLVRMPAWTMQHGPPAYTFKVEMEEPL